MDLRSKGRYQNFDEPARPSARLMMEAVRTRGCFGQVVIVTGAGQCLGRWSVDLVSFSWSSHTASVGCSPGNGCRERATFCPRSDVARDGTMATHDLTGMFYGPVSFAAFAGWTPAVGAV